VGRGDGVELPYPIDEFSLLDALPRAGVRRCAVSHLIATQRVVFPYCSYKSVHPRLGYSSLDSTMGASTDATFLQWMELWKPAFSEGKVWSHAYKLFQS
jgi:hypothetical protein